MAMDLSSDQNTFRNEARDADVQCSINAYIQTNCCISLSKLLVITAEIISPLECEAETCWQ